VHILARRCFWRQRNDLGKLSIAEYVDREISVIDVFDLRPGPALLTKLLIGSGPIGLAGFRKRLGKRK
jgi:hypothetical protein